MRRRDPPQLRGQRRVLAAFSPAVTLRAAWLSQTRAGPALAHFQRAPHEEAKLVRCTRGAIYDVINGKGELVDRVKLPFGRVISGFGKGVAVPHVKHPAAKSVLGAVGLSAEGIDFSALDEQPVYSVILLISPVDNPDKHLQAMENIFRHLQKERFRKFLRQCRTPAELEDLLNEADDKPSW